jgi:hypothetical protein
VHAQDPTCLAILREIDAQVGIDIWLFGCTLTVFRAVLNAKNGRWHSYRWEASTLTTCTTIVGTRTGWSLRTSTRMRSMRRRLDAGGARREGRSRRHRQWPGCGGCSQTAAAAAARCRTIRTDICAAVPR